ncbi:hypothetical protein [Sabulicella rubraurantiaca]|uniref:hypothetical protein n=1 Tax=Sabulicella rubraurantiaca TaxID=2811429 RepID=UPI001A961216|nr:hypothetical protein [Sabulicella rubraurantiaca]
MDGYADGRGLLVTAANGAAVALLEEAVLAILADAPDAANWIGVALIADPGLVLALALQGFQLRLRAHPEMEVALNLALARGGLALRGGTARGRALVEALAAWHEEGAAKRAAATLEACAAEELRDALSAALAGVIRCGLGVARARDSASCRGVRLLPDAA